MEEKLTVYDYIKSYKDIVSESEKNDAEKEKFKIALLASSTIKALKEILYVKCYKMNLICEFYESIYNKYAEDIFNEKSELYKFTPDLIIIFIDIMSLIGEDYYLPYNITVEEREKQINSKLHELTIMIEKLKKNLSSKIIVHNFCVPTFSPLGILESKEEFGFIESIETLNFHLREKFKKDKQVFIFDFNSFCSKIGKENVLDYNLLYSVDLKVSIHHFPELCEEYLSYIKPLKSKIKKCIVLDLDNTLWGGIAGEDGLEGINLGPTSTGRVYLDFQKYLLSLNKMGIILAINSKNNPEDALNIIRNHPYMVLKEDNFSDIEINWDDKITNMVKISKKLNIGLDSMVFIDDDKLNRDMIKKALPEVTVVELPDNPALYVSTLINLKEFNSFYLTEEDVKKSKMYEEQRKREEFKKDFNDIDEYLKELNIEVTIDCVNKLNLARIVQLTQKTNQFNLTTKRYTQEAIEALIKNGNYLIFSAKVRDKFGDNGITGVVILEKNPGEWRIDTFLLSCRVIGRKIEKVMLAYIVEKAKSENIAKIIGEYIPTEKNTLVKDFYKDNGFLFIGEKEKKQIWELKINSNINVETASFIKVIDKTRELDLK
ncbi:hypothetical protein Q428_02305 [Fervidicella metallireducens AeB]|uniref:BF1531-like N-terminal domain-containing protein n=1 Tax=Fervidicella metallireducens AeB TaxID=1403537 RepID=A0A017RXY7_9CLOT|nr:HAD-IIIC family phosphatase [Fervidicella metallireducens]EYE89446.1 hypothetical protein Q428_02305 [Fervidicella metallireducens AeB]